MCFNMVGAQGFEPWTNGLKVRCATAAPYSQILLRAAATVRTEHLTGAVFPCLIPGTLLIKTLLRTYPRS